MSRGGELDQAAIDTRLRRGALTMQAREVARRLEGLGVDGVVELLLELGRVVEESGEQTERRRIGSASPPRALAS